MQVSPQAFHAHPLLHAYLWSQRYQGTAPCDGSPLAEAPHPLMILEGEGGKCVRMTVAFSVDGTCSLKPVAVQGLRKYMAA